MTRQWFAVTCFGAAVLVAGCRNDSSPSKPDEAQAQPKVDREKLIGTWTGPDPRGGEYKQLELKFSEDGTGTMRTEIQSSRINGTISEGMKYKIDPASTQVRIEYGGDLGRVEFMPDGKLRVTLGQDAGLLEKRPG